MKMDRKNKNEKKKKGNSSSLKVVYISSPMKVKTTASRFRSLVQQLTGRDSDITRSMDIVENCNNFNDSENNVPQKGTTKLGPNDDQYQELQYFSLPMDHRTPTPGDSPSPTSSESLIEQQEVFGNCEAFLSSEEVEDQFLQDVFSSSMFFDQYSQAHLLEGYDAM